MGVKTREMLARRSGLVGKVLVLSLLVMAALSLWTTRELPAAPVQTNISQTNGKSWAPVVAADPSGNVHVVWTEETTSNSEISYRRWNGNAGSEIENLSQNSGVSQSPSLFADIDGNVHVVWQDNTYGNNKILYRRWDGSSWSPVETLSQNVGQSISPAVTVDSGGYVQVVWSYNTGGNYQIFSRRGYNSAWTEIEPVSGTAGDSLGAAIAAGPQGDVHVAWHDNSSGNWEILYRRWDGATWSPTDNLSRNSGASTAPTLGVDSQGKVHLAWQDNTYGNNEILYRRWNGGGWYPVENLSSNRGDSGEPQAAVDSSGKLHVVSQDDTPGNYDIFYRRWADAVWSTVENLSQNSGDSGKPAIAVDTRGRVHVVWHDNTPGNYDILYTSFVFDEIPPATSTPTLTGAPTTTPTPTPATTPTGSQIQLAEGWNLISVPRVPEDPSLSAVFAQAISVTKVYTSQGGVWAYAIRGSEGWGGNLSQIVDGIGYYVYSTAPTSIALQLKPTVLAPPASYGVPAGWSLIGYASSLETMPVDTYLGSLRGTWSSLFRYDATKGWELAKPSSMGFPEVESGRGYWIYLTSPGTLVPPSSPAATPSPTPAATFTPLPTPAPTPASGGVFLIPNVTVRAGRTPTTEGQDAFTPPPDDCPSVLRAPPARLRPAPEIDGVADLDVLYIERTPKYPYSGPKTFPRPGERVTFTAHVANKGGVPTRASSQTISIRWRVVDPSGKVIADLASAPNVVIGPADIASFQLGWTWIDGPYQIRFTVNEDGHIREGRFTNNNDLSIYTNALTAGFAFNESLYDWMNSIMSGEPDVGRFYWFSRPADSAPFRSRTYSTEDWAQRQIAQLNEYFTVAEDQHMDGVRNSLPRIALQQIEIVSDSVNLSQNSPLPQQGDWGTLDVVWGFPAQTPRGQIPVGCSTAGEQGWSNWYRYYNPEFRNVEFPLLHEIGHEFALWHEDDATGAFEFNPITSHITLLDDSLAIPNLKYGGERSELDGLMLGNFSRGFSEYATRTLAYRFQSIPRRGVPSRIGPMNGSWGGAVPRGQGAYWDAYPVSSPMRWPFFESPRTVDIRLADSWGKPVTGAKVDFYVPMRALDAHTPPSGLRLPFSVRWSGKFTPSRSGTYRFVTYSLGNVLVNVAGTELINPDGANPIFLFGGRRAYEPGREFRHGLLDTNPITLKAGVSYPFFIEYSSADVYGGYRFGVFYKSPDSNPPFGLSEIRFVELRTEDNQSTGLTARYWNGELLGRDGPLVETRIDSRPELMPANSMIFGFTPTVQAISDNSGIVHLDSVPFLADPGSWPAAMVAVVTRGSSQSIRIVPMADLNFAYWSGSKDAATINLSLTLDGVRSPLENR